MCVRDEIWCKIDFLSGYNSILKALISNSARVHSSTYCFVKSVHFAPMIFLNIPTNHIFSEKSFKTGSTET